MSTHMSTHLSVHMYTHMFIHSWAWCMTEGKWILKLCAYVWVSAHAFVCGVAWHGMAWHGMAWHGMAWHDM